MVYAPHAYTTLRGTLGGAATGADIWQVGFRWEFTGTAGGSVMDSASVEAVDEAWRVAFGGMAMSTATKYEECRGYVIGADGKALGPPTISAPATPQGGGSSSALHPWSVSTVITLDALGQRKGRFGRIYLPPQGVTTDANGRFSDAAALQYATAISTFFDTVITATSAGEALYPVVASRTMGTLRRVQEVRCGNVQDTQRRRDNRLQETYQVVVL